MDILSDFMLIDIKGHNLSRVFLFLLARQEIVSFYSFWGSIECTESGHPTCQQINFLPCCSLFHSLFLCLTCMLELYITLLFVGSWIWNENSKKWYTQAINHESNVLLTSRLFKGARKSFLAALKSVAVLRTCWASFWDSICSALLYRCFSWTTQQRRQPS